MLSPRFPSHWLVFVALLCSSFVLAQEASTARRSVMNRRPILSPVTESDTVAPDESVAPITTQNEISTALSEAAEDDEAEHVTGQQQAHHQHGMLNASAGCDACNGWGCDMCSGRGRHNHHGGRGGPLSGFYARYEMLYWWTRGMYAPPLVSTSPDGTDRLNAGVLGTPGAETLFGGEGLNNNGRLGGRVSLGFWLDDCRTRSIEGDFFYLGDMRQGYTATSLGSPILSRPYYDAVEGFENAELVAYPGVLAGTIAVDPITKFMGAGLRTRWNMCGCSDDACDPCGQSCGQNSCSVDFTVGYRMLRLSDRLHIREDLTSLLTANPGSFVVQDEFRTWNTFHGLELGTVYSRSQGLWSIEMLSRISLGMTASEAKINGSTDITTNGVTTSFIGGNLAQRTNIGTYYHEAFSIAPELGMTLGYRITPRMRLTCGYSLLYWTGVLRAGQVIDRDINKNLSPPENPIETTHLRPIYRFQDTDFWAMGLNVGLEGNW